MHTSIKRKWLQGECCTKGYFDAAKSNSKIWHHKVNNGVSFLLWCHWWNQFFEFGITSGLVDIPYREVVRFCILWRCSISNIIQTFIMGHMYITPFLFFKMTEDERCDDSSREHDDYLFTLPIIVHCTINHTRSRYQLQVSAECFMLHASWWIWTGMLPSTFLFLSCTMAYRGRNTYHITSCSPPRPTVI